MMIDVRATLDGCIEAIENSMGEGNDYDKGYYEALIMVRDKILKESRETQ